MCLVRTVSFHSLAPRPSVSKLLFCFYPLTLWDDNSFFVSSPRVSYRIYKCFCSYRALVSVAAAAVASFFPIIIPGRSLAMLSVPRHFFARRLLVEARVEEAIAYGLVRSYMFTHPSSYSPTVPSSPASFFSALASHYRFFFLSWLSTTHTYNTTTISTLLVRYLVAK